MDELEILVGERAEQSSDLVVNRMGKIYGTSSNLRKLNNYSVKTATSFQ